MVVGPGGDLGRLTMAQRRSLEEKLLRKAASRRRVADEPTPRSADAVVPLAPIQRRLWFFHELIPDEPLYNSPFCFWFDGPLDVEALVEALATVVDRHEQLRTTIGVGESGAPVQLVHPDARLDVTVADLGQVPPGRRRTVAEERFAEESRRTFDLTCETPVRARILRFDERTHALGVFLHHIASDGRSLNILVEELEAGYRAYRAGVKPDLPELPLQYADFAIWQDRQQATPAWQAEIEYWRERLDGIPPAIGLPFDRPREQKQGVRGDMLEVEIALDLAARVRALAARHNATESMVLLAAYHTLLYRYSGDRSVAVGIPVSGRNHAKLENLIGFFVNSLPIRLDFDQSVGFSALVDRARDAVIGAMDHQTVPFDVVAGAVTHSRDLGHNPIFQTMLQLNPAGLTSLRLDGVSCARIIPAMGTSDFDISVYFTSMPDGRVHGLFEYSTDLFDRATVSRLAHHYVTLLEALVTEPHTPVAAIPLLSSQEHAQAVERWSGPGERPVPRTYYHEYVAAYAATRPDAVAVECGNDRLTYGELDALTSRIARRLRGRGVGPEAVVAIVMDSSIDTVVALLAVLKAGGTFLCVDPRYPDAWREYVLADSGAGLGITSAGLELPMNGVPALVLEDLIGARDDVEPDAVPPGGPMDGHQAACVIYTGGSTGRPKGVVLEHRNLANYVAHSFTLLGVTEADRCLQFSSPSFDAYIEEVGFALSTGATLVIRDRDFDLSANGFAEWVRDRRISVISLPTSYWHELIDADAGPPLAANDTLRLVAIGGEAASSDRVRRWRREVGDAIRLYNGYAPCECTVTSSWQELTGADDGAEVPIGRPVNNCRMYVLDEFGNPVGVGITGELHIGGAGVTRGYAGRADLTARAFRPDPFAHEPGSRLYRTGDRARCRADGTFVLTGRVDQQIKLRGYRIEPGDVEVTLREHPLVRDALVRAHGDGAERRLVAYVVADRAGPGTPPANVLVEEVRDHVADRLPDYMAPAAFVLLEALPRTPSGKLDAGRLPDPDPVDRAGGRTQPRDGLELRLLLMWRELLCTEVGTRDDFFGHGGHSLLAVQLVHRIERELGRSIPVSALFPHATVERIARLVRDGDLAPRSLVRLSGSGQAPSTLFIHSVGGDVVSYLTLARHWPKTMAFDAVRAPALDGGEPLTDIASAAAAYWALATADAAGPPRTFGGWSMGGVIALEIARLAELGHGVAAPVVAIDSVLRHRDTPETRDRSDEALRWAFAADLARSLRVAGVPERTASDGEDPLKALVRELISEGLLPATSGFDWVERRREVFAAHLAASVAYRPRPYAGRVLLLLAEGRPDAGQVVRDWEAVAEGGLTVHALPADHYSIVTDPVAAQVADLVGEWLGRERTP